MASDYVDESYAQTILGVATHAALLRLLRRHRIPYLRLLGVYLYPRHQVEALARRLRMKRNPTGSRARYVHRRVRSPRSFVRGSFRTIKAGKARVILGRLKGDRRRTRTGRRRLTVQAILTPKKNPLSETEMLKRIQGWAGQIRVGSRVPQWARFLAEQIEDRAMALIDQIAHGIHENPQLAVVGANPPMGRVIEIRYRRDRGKYPGYYRHVFRRHPVMVALADGSLKIGPA